MHPKLRDDLIFSEQVLAGTPTAVIKDPRRERFYQFQEAELFIARQLDGETPPEEILKRTEARFDAELDRESLDVFLRSLDKLGLLTSSLPSVPGASQKRTDPLYLRFKVFDPSALFARVVGRVGFFFTPQFIALSVAAIAFAAILMATSWPEIVRELTQIDMVHGIVLAWITILSVGMAHEFAHGATCTHFGGQVREMGFYLLYLNPALYCNVSDSWMFPKRSQRLWVMMAGGYFEMFLWAIATFAWRLTDAGTLPNTVSLIVMMTSGLKTLFNFNPLIKLDGYYLLSDLLEIPNLRKKAFRYIGSNVGRFFGSSDKLDEPSPRERRIFMLYGVIAAVYLMVFFWLVAIKLGTQLLPRFHWLGLVIVGLLLFLRGKSRWTAFMGGDRTSKTNSKSKSSSKPPVRWRDPRRWAPLAGAMLLVVFGGCLELKVPGEITMLPMHNADVHAEVDGLVAEILVNEGQDVAAGQLLARLSDREHRAELGKTEADLAERRAHLRMLEAGARPLERSIAQGDLQRARLAEDLAVGRIEEATRQQSERLIKAQSTVRKAEERLKFARSHTERLRALRDAEVLSQREFEVAEEQLAVRETEHDEAVAELNIVMADNLSEAQRGLATSQRDLAQAEGRVRLMHAGTREEELEATRAEVQRLETQKTFLEEQVRLTEVRSPIPGVVTTPERLLGEMTGRYVKRGDLIAEVYELKFIKAEIAVPEKEIADVRVGQRVLVKARAFPGHVFEGSVTSIATTAHGPMTNNASTSTGATAPGRSHSSGRYVLVTTQLKNEGLLLKPEMTGKAKVLCGKRRIIELLTRGLSHTFRVEFWSWW